VNNGILGETDMSREWRDNAWKLLDDEEECHVWEQFEETFHFSPSYHGTDSGIQEPFDSITFDISAYYASQTPEVLEQEVNACLFPLFTMISFSHAFIYALDWQHPCYKVFLAEFDVHRYNSVLFHHVGLLGTSEDGINYYLVPIIPDGDYSIFSTPDMTNGIFGHPWRNTICIFGKELLNALESHMPTLFQTPIRRHGKSIE
jgi:hypothetical protein